VLTSILTVLLVEPAAMDTGVETRATSVLLLESVTTAPPEGAALVIESASVRVPKAVVEAVRAVGHVIEVEGGKPKPKEFVAREARLRHLRLEPGVIEALEALFGSRLQALSAALDQLAFEGFTRVAEDDVRSRFAEDLGATDLPPWLVTDAVEAGDAGRAVGALAPILHRAGLTDSDRRGAALKTHGYLAYRARQLADAVGHGVRSRADAEQALGLRGFPAEKLARVAATLRPGHVRRIYALLAETDLELKGGSELPEAFVIERLVVDLCAIFRGARS